MSTHGAGTYSVCIPWRSTPERQPIFDYVKKWWESHGFVEGESLFFGDLWDGVMADDKKPVFSLAEARNAVVRKAHEDGVIILADADTIPDIEVVEKQAVQIAREHGHVIYPFTEYRYLNSLYIPSIEEGQITLDTALPTWIKEDSVGGILVTSSKTYWDLGGMDEKFERTWGFEDNAFVAVADTLAKVVRLPGKVYSFSHDVEGAGRDWTKLNPNYWRNELYQHCWGNTKLMKELIK